MLEHLTAVVPLDTLDTTPVVTPSVQVHARVLLVVRPASEQVPGAGAAIPGLAAVVEPRPRGKVDGVAGVVHRDVDVEVALVLVRGSSLGAVSKNAKLVETQDWEFRLCDREGC